MARKKKAVPKKVTGNTPKPKRKRRTKAQMLAAKVSEQKKAAGQIRKVSKSSNTPAAIKMVSASIIDGAVKSEIIKTVMANYKISDTESLYNAALEYIRNDHFKDNISFYANHIAELEYLFSMAVGRGVPKPEDTKHWIVDYKEARTILKQIEDATLTVNQILQFY